MLARDRHEAYFRERPLESDRDYLLACFREAGRAARACTPSSTRRTTRSFASASVATRRWRCASSGSRWTRTPERWRTTSPTLTGTPASSATCTRTCRSHAQAYALLQTPEFVGEFILDRTLTPAIREFGFREVRMIDPTCGSGTSCWAAFVGWSTTGPIRAGTQSARHRARALDAVAGVDLNPFAVAISRFRLLVAALKISGSIDRPKRPTSI